MNQVEVEPFVAELGKLFSDEVSIGLALPYTLLHPSVSIHPLLKGAQSVHYETKGAFTGEISAEMLVKSKCQFTLVGHSERRHGIKEGRFGDRCKRALEAGLLVIFCVGETNSQREQEETESVIREQLEDVRLLYGEYRDRVWIAYEPVWAIGTGKAATPGQADKVHQLIKQVLPDITVLYGGSVTAENAQTLANQPHIDGFLVGGQSLNADSFGRICTITVTP